MQTVAIDKKICLGDIVNLGPFPNECIELVIKEFNYIIMGESDNAIFNKEEADAMPPLAKESIEWNKKQITDSNKEILQNLDYGYVIEDDILLVHGSPRAPFELMLNESNALNGFANPIHPFNIAFVGHTHQPGVWQLMENGHLAYLRTNFNNNFSLGCEYSLVIPKSDRAIINVGAVGQPRDNDPRACYVVYDTETRHLTFYRIPYSIDRTIGRMQQLSFPTNAWLRLLYGN
jgi:diadenosine tetraphosphatase ApaH/serine/threonine PP2A family protein phosphatase